MIKKKTIETLYILFVLLVLAVYGCVSMQDSDNTADMTASGLLTYATMASFVVLSLYLLFTVGDVFSNKPQEKLFWRWTWYYLYVALFLVIMVLIPSAYYTFVGQVFNVLTAVLPYLVMLTMYIYVRRNGCSALFLTAVFCVMLLLVVQYYRIYSLAEELGGGHIGVSYHPLFLLPVLMLHPSKIFRYLSVGIVLVVLFSSMKRGGLLAFGMGMLAYILVQEHVNSKKRFRSWLMAVIAIAVLGSAFWYLGTHNDNYVLERFMDIQEDEGSGRVDVWKQSWSMIIDSDIVSFLLGHGYNAVLKNSPLYLSAHNDWLEVWYDYGLIGVLLLAFTMVSWLRFALHLYIEKSPIAAPCFMLGVVVGVLTMISHVIIYPWMAWVCLCIGVFVGEVDRKKILHE